MLLTSSVKIFLFFKCTSPCVPRSALFPFLTPHLCANSIRCNGGWSETQNFIAIHSSRVAAPLPLLPVTKYNKNRRSLGKKQREVLRGGGGNEGRVCWVLKKRHRNEPQKIAAFFFVLRHSNNARPATKQQTIWGIQMCNQPKGQKTKMCESCCSCCSCCWCCYCCCCCCVAAAAIWVRKSLHTETVKGIYSSVNPFAQPGSSCILLLRFSLAFWECECHWATVSAVNCLCGSALHLRLMSINYAQHRKRLQRQ